VQWSQNSTMNSSAAHTNEDLLKADTIGKQKGKGNKVFQSHLDVSVVTRGKNDINTVRFFTQTARFVS